MDVFTLKFGNFITNGSLWKKADDLNNIESKTEKIIYITVAKYESLFNIWQGATHKMHHVRLAGWRCSYMWIKRSQSDSICATLLALVLMVYMLSPIWIGPEAAHWYSKGKHTDFIIIGKWHTYSRATQGNKRNLLVGLVREGKVRQDKKTRMHVYIYWRLRTGSQNRSPREAR